MKRGLQILTIAILCIALISCQSAPKTTSSEVSDGGKAKVSSQSPAVDSVKKDSPWRASITRVVMIILFIPMWIFSDNVDDRPGMSNAKPPNKALVPTVASVTPAADAPVAPAVPAAHL